MEVSVFRIDDRLIHGQVITAGLLTLEQRVS